MCVQIMVKRRKTLRKARFDYQDLNLWETVAFDSHIDVDFSSSTTNNYLKVVLRGNAQKQLRKLIQVMRTAQTNISVIRNLDYSVRLTLFVNSGKMDSWSYAIRAYSAAVSIKERHDVTRTTLDVISSFARHGSEDDRNRLVKVPDLFASIANLCTEELLQEVDCRYMLTYVFYIVNALSLQLSALLEANWTGFIVRSLKYTDKKNSQFVKFILYLVEILKFL